MNKNIFTETNIYMGPKKEEFEGRAWILSGLVWAVLSLILSQIFMLIASLQKIDIIKIFTTQLPIWLIGGLVWGYCMKFYFPP